MTFENTTADGYHDADRPISQPAKPEKIWPITASADGSLNSHCLRCAVTGQGMGYAACLWRQDVLSNVNAKTPADWNVCRESAASGSCVALRMRHEEVVAGKAIYFRERVKDRNVVEEPKRKWIDTLRTVGEKVKAVIAPKPRVDGDEFDAMAAASDMAAVATRVSAAHAAATPPAASIPTSAVTALAGETPLQMAMRIKAEREAAQAQ